jgi:hypothetical protein
MAFGEYYNSSTLNLILASFFYLFTRCRKFNSLVAAVTIPPSRSLYISGVTNITADMPDEQRLFYTLMTGYEKAVRPTKKGSEPVIVKLGITLTQIMDIVSKSIIAIFLVFLTSRMNVIK